MNSVLVAEQRNGRVSVPAVDRAARLLGALSAHAGDAPHQPGVSASELSRELGISKSTLSGLLTTLEQHGLVRRDPLTRRVRLGLALLELAAAVEIDVDVREAARPHLARLCRDSGETAILHLVSGDDVRIAERAEPASQLKVVAPLGTPLPRFAGSVAKVLLAADEPAEAEAIVHGHKLPSFTARSIVEPGAYLEQVAQTRRRGYARENEEYLVGVSAVSAPVINHEGRTIGTISVACVKTRARERLQELTEPVMDAAAETSRRLGAPGEGRWRSPRRANNSSRST
ncbi:MAG TPA: IclR family transcriptional regulator [Solirubrobacteraceae bacterium]|nr:IclR family transcriptional regulator [Solirubrobacteraceae bacterium]